MSAPTSDRDLLERLKAAALANGPEASDCEALAERLLAVGATGIAVRWRTWGLLPADPDRLLEGIEEARRQLLQGGEGASEQAPPLPEAWRALQQRITAGASSQELEDAVRQRMKEPLPPRDALLAFSDQLLNADAPRAALMVLDPLMREAAGDARLCNRLAGVQRACGNAHQAELWSRLSLRADPKQPLIWFQLARLLLDQEAHDEALECAEAGLGFAEAHPWGLKLRANALLASRGWHTYAVLRERGGLPADPDFVAALDRERQRWEARAGFSAAQAPAPLPLDARLRLRSLFKTNTSPVALIHGRTGDALRWLLETGAWAEAPAVIPLASRDPLRVASSLRAAGFRLQAERSLRELTALTDLSLIVLERPPGRRLPLALGKALGSSALILAPFGLLRLAERRLGWHGGWELFAGAAGEAQQRAA